VTPQERAEIHATLLAKARGMLETDPWAIFSAAFVAEILDAAIAEEREAVRQSIDLLQAGGTPPEAILSVIQARGSAMG
jgi:hypothetical protein